MSTFLPIIFTYLVQGGYTNWSKWSACSKSCGGGEKKQTRSCTNPTPDNGGQNCVEQGLGADEKTAACNVKPCVSKCTVKTF